MALYVLSRHHGEGIGRHLTTHMARTLGKNGREGMIVWVLADNPARDFYEHRGAIEAGEQIVTVGDQEYREIAFVWQDLARLIA